MYNETYNKEYDFDLEEKQNLQHLKETINWPEGEIKEIITWLESKKILCRNTHDKDFDYDFFNFWQNWKQEKLKISFLKNTSLVNAPYIKIHQLGTSEEYFLYKDWTIKTLSKWTISTPSSNLIVWSSYRSFIESIPFLMQGFIPKTDFEKAYYTMDNVATIQKNMAKIQDTEWIVTVASKLQSNAWIVTKEEVEEIKTWYEKFLVWFNLLFAKNKSKKGDILLAIQQDPNSEYLEEIKNEEERICVYTLLELFQKHVEYSTENNFWSTFIWFKNFDPTKKILMDCDIMSMVAYDILKKNNIDMVLLAQYDNSDSESANHANGKVWNTSIERTNFKNWWYTDSDMIFEEKKWSNKILSDFMNTYRFAGENLLSQIEEIHQSFIGFALDQENSYNLYISLHNFCTWHQDIKKTDQEYYTYIDGVMRIGQYLQHIQATDEGKSENFSLSKDVYQWEIEYLIDDIWKDHYIGKQLTQIAKSLE